MRSFITSGSGLGLQKFQYGRQDFFMFLCILLGQDFFMILCILFVSESIYSALLHRVTEGNTIFQSES